MASSVHLDGWRKLKEKKFTGVAVSFPIFINDHEFVVVPTSSHFMPKYNINDNQWDESFIKFPHGVR